MEENKHNKETGVDEKVEVRKYFSDSDDDDVPPAPLTEAQKAKKKRRESSVGDRIVPVKAPRGRLQSRSLSLGRSDSRSNSATSRRGRSLARGRSRHRNQSISRRNGHVPHYKRGDQFDSDLESVLGSEEEEYSSEDEKKPPALDIYSVNRHTWPTLVVTLSDKQAIAVALLKGNPQVCKHIVGWHSDLSLLKQKKYQLFTLEELQTYFGENCQSGIAKTQDGTFYAIEFQFILVAAVYLTFLEAGRQKECYAAALSNPTIVHKAFTWDVFRQVVLPVLDSTKSTEALSKLVGVGKHFYETGEQLAKEALARNEEPIETVDMSVARHQPRPKQQRQPLIQGAYPYGPFPAMGPYHPAHGMFPSMGMPPYHSMMVPGMYAPQPPPQQHVHIHGGTNNFYSGASSKEDDDNKLQQILEGQKVTHGLVKKGNNDNKEESKRTQAMVEDIPQKVEKVVSTSKGPPPSAAKARLSPTMEEAYSNAPSSPLVQPASLFEDEETKDSSDEDGYSSDPDEYLPDDDKPVVEGDFIIVTVVGVRKVVKALAVTGSYVYFPWPNKPNNKTRRIRRNVVRVVKKSS